MKIDATEELAHIPVENKNRLLLGDIEEISDEEIKRMMGDNYFKIISTMLGMTDTFGLCGIVAVHASGLLSNFILWKDVSYEPQEYKRMFDERTKLERTHVSADKEIELASAAFDKNYEHLGAKQCEDFTVNSVQDLRNALEGLKQFQGMLVALLLDFPIVGGEHTHWLAIRQDDTSVEEVNVVGDLSPFGIRSFGIRMRVSKLAELMMMVPGGSATTGLTQTLAPTAQKAGLLTADNTFIHNASIYTFCTTD